MPIPIEISTTCVRTLPRSSSSTTIAPGCIRRWAITHRKSSSTRLARRPLQPEPPCGYSGLERWLEPHRQPGIRLKQQRRGEEHHSINHQVCSFLCLTGGVHPRVCAKFVLKISLKAHSQWNQRRQWKPPKSPIHRGKRGNQLKHRVFIKTSCCHS